MTPPRVAWFGPDGGLAAYTASAGRVWDLTESDRGRTFEAIAGPREWLNADGSLHPSLRRVDGVGGGLFILGEDDGAVAFRHRLSEMASVVAHEVKNPLAGVGSALRVLLTRLGAGSMEQAITHEMILRLKTLNDTIDDLLLFARPVRIQRGVTPMRPVIDGAIADLADHPDGRDVEVAVVGEAPDLRVDATLIRRSLRNLLLNAAQAVGPRGRIELRIRTDAEGVRLEVHDPGPGIGAGLERKVFEPFFTQRSRGIGLGLPVARRIADVHDGRVDYDASSTDTCFVLKLPVE